MGRCLRFVTAIALLFIYNYASAQAPSISYASPQVYAAGTAIATLSPTNTGGAVTAFGFGAATALTGATLSNPHGINIDPSGNVYVTNSSNNTISKYNSSGTYIGTFGSGAAMSFPKGVVFDSFGNAYVLNLGASAGTGSVYKYNSSGVYQSTILSGLNYALGITIDASDNIYIADQGATTVKKYSTAGALLLSLPTANLSTPLGVAVDGSGNIYVVNNGASNITKYNSAGTFQSLFLSGFTSLQSIAIDGAGNLYVGDNSAANTIYVYNQSGTLLASRSANDPEGVCIDTKGDIYATNYSASQVNEYKPTGGYFLSGSLPVGLSFNTSTGAITGTPTVATATTNYTITAYNASGSSSATVGITVNPAAPTVPGVTVCGSSGTATITASGGSPAGGTYNWYTAAAGGTLLQSSVSTTYSATISATTTYYVSYTVSGLTSTRTAATATLSPVPSSTFTATVGNVGSTATITYTGTDPNTSTYAWNFNGGTPATGTGQGPFSVQWASSGTKTITLTITNAGGCSATSTQTVTINGTSYSTYAFRIPLTLNTTGLGSTTDLTNFPYLVSIVDPTLVVTPGSCTNKVQFPNGPAYDFAFVDAVSGEIPYQVESYDQTTGTLLAWVKIPTLTHSTNNTLVFYFGSATAPATHTTAFYQTTWNSDYQAIYHFNESTYTGSVTDGTSNAHTGATSGMTSADLVTGKIGTAYSFNGSSKKITAAAASLTGAFTISAWVNLTATAVDQRIMTNQAASGSSSGGYKLNLHNSQAEAESGTATNRASTPTAPTVTTGNWYYMQGVYTSSQLTTYVNGVQYKVLATTNNPLANPTLYIGVGEGGTSFYFNGMIDEARVSNIAKSTDWLMAEYTNQNNPAAFTTAGTETAYFTNAQNINGAVVYTTSNGTTYTYTLNGVVTSGTPANNGTASFIISGTASLPTTASIYALTINAGDKVDLNGQIIDVGCNIVNNGTVTNSSAAASTVNFNGKATTQTYTGSSTSVAQVSNFIVNNSAAGTVTITGGGVNVYKALTLTKGSLFIDNTNSGALTLKSTSSQSAGVAAIPAGSTITGTVNVERYISGGAGYRGYRLLSSPVYAAAVSPNNVYSINYLQNSTYITGTAGGGFDKTGNPTLYLYREDKTPTNAGFTNGNFWGISAINNTPNYNYYLNGGATPYNIPVGNGFMFFFRGDRSAAVVGTETSPAYVPVTVTLTTSGTLNTGQIIVYDWYTPGLANLGYTGIGAGTNFAVRGFNLVGNPYASSIDWELYNTTTPATGIYASNVGNTIYELNPATNNYDTYQKGGAFTNHGTRTIASGQGFFVLASSSTSPLLIFNETAKTATQNTTAALTLFMAAKRDVEKLQNGGVDQHLRLQLAMDSIHTDDMYIGFKANASARFVTDEDAPYKAGNGSVSLASMSSDNVPLAINKLPLPSLNASIIPLHVTARSNGAYSLNMMELEAVPQLYEVWLLDRYRKDSLDMRHNKTYLFDITADTNSYGNKRFQLVIRQNPSLAVHLLDFTAAKTTNGAQIAWKTENEQNYTSFAVERSNDNGVSFNALGGLASNGLGSYSFLDLNPLVAANQYRLKLTDLNGAISYSRVVTLQYSTSVNSIAKSDISIFPNPASSIINLTINRTSSQLNPPTRQTINLAPGITSSLAARSYGIKLINTTGSVIKTASSSQASWQDDVSGLLPGTYVIQVMNNNDKSVVGQATFVKL